MYKNNTKDLTVTKLDPLGVVQSYLDIYHSWTENPDNFQSDLINFLNLSTKINYQVLLRNIGEDIKNEPITPRTDNEHLKDPMWNENPISELLKEYHLLYKHLLLTKINATKDVDNITKKRADFWTQQFFNALSPANFFMLNPRAIMNYLETGGKSVEDSLQILADDLSRQDISMVKSSEFEIGKNLASTEGKVIFRNDIFELIQYSPMTEKVHSVPILIVPPWINKYYILDLNSKKSIIQHLLKQNFTVFLISWRNPPASMRNTTFTDYLMDGILKAIDVTKNVCNVEQIHCVGYCIGGTALGTLLAWLNSEQQEVKNNPVAHYSLFCSLFTFEQPGEIDIFIDENIVSLIEESMKEKGYLDGKQMGNTFRLLRSNSLIWSYFANSYLLGKKPMSFDVLFWNSDNTRIPEKTHSFYLRNYYLNNKLAKKDGMEIKGQKLDLSKIKQPVYAVGTEADHITPWKETFKSINMTGGEKRYVLSTSGHIVGIINPPVNPPKRDYWVNNLTSNEDADHWYCKQEKISGSWWEDWTKWLENKCGNLIKPPEIGNNKYKVLCNAPGTYVKE